MKIKFKHKCETNNFNDPNEKLYTKTPQFYITLKIRHFSSSLPQKNFYTTMIRWIFKCMAIVQKNSKHLTRF